jgi:hypothetical protein
MPKTGYRIQNVFYKPGVHSLSVSEYLSIVSMKLIKTYHYYFCAVETGFTDILAIRACIQKIERITATTISCPSIYWGNSKKLFP